MSIKLKVMSFVLILCAACAQAAAAAQPQPSPAAQEANALYQAQQWDGAARAYEAIVRNEPTNPQAWYRLGTSLHRLGKYTDAVAAFEKAHEVGKGQPIAPFVMYNLASSYARLGEKEKALDWLSKAMEANIPQANNMKNDPDFVALQSLPRFMVLTRAAEKKAKPCLFDEATRQFDFWVGEWDVFNPQGQKLGTSSIRMLVDGCTIEENWGDMFGGSGKSLNVYNPVTRKWHQTYIGSAGAVWMLDGEYKDGALRYEGQMYARGGPVMVRVTFFKLESPDKVRHLSETSPDGKTWTPSWDGMYVRRKADSAGKQ
jgi:tetratricopeptide (TPR) repeat protein